MNVQLRGEKKDELHRSRKKIDAPIAPCVAASEEAHPPVIRQVVSYKDSLLGEDYGSFADTVRMDGNYSGDDEPMQEVYKDGELSVSLDVEEKRRLRQIWSHSLIVKVYGKTVGYRFWKFKLGQLWSSIGKPCIVDLGQNFYLIKFQCAEDYNFVIKEGPWFIAGHFLTLRKYEPNLRASKASFTSVAVWVKLPQLLMEYFDLQILKKIGKSIGVMLRVDGHTLADERGKYARICVQVSLEKPLPTYIKVEGRKQVLVYESIGLLCFHCGKLGHTKTHCLELQDKTHETSGSLCKVEKSDAVLVDNAKASGSVPKTKLSHGILVVAGSF
ncbi:hypothetical protein REPUB_Repub02eG0206400 [Reevesia pubescens]